MLWLKSCGRCEGDVYMDKDEWGQYISCLQCGAVRDVDTPRARRNTMSSVATLPVKEESVRVALQKLVAG